MPQAPHCKKQHIEWILIILLQAQAVNFQKHMNEASRKVNTSEKGLAHLISMNVCWNYKSCSMHFIGKINLGSAAFSEFSLVIIIFFKLDFLKF